MTSARAASLADTSPTSRYVSASRPLQALARILALLLIAVVISLITVPWVQTSVGQGQVVARSPSERRQLVEAPIDGRISHWHVKEGTFVRAGEPLVDLADNDVDFDDRLAVEETAALSRVEAVRARGRAVESRIRSLEISRSNAVDAADRRAVMATERKNAAVELVRAADAAAVAAEANRSRQQALASRGLASDRTAELAEMELARALSEADRSRATHRAAEEEELAARADRGKATSDAAALVEDAQASLASIRAEEAVARTELARVEVRLARQASRLIVAPRDGLIQRASGGAGGEQVKAGDPLLWLIPEVREHAVEVFIDGNDVPLVHAGRRARLQFEGWPAVQFSGWPSVAVGTFGGDVAAVDTAADERGKFRILVVPGPADAWPEEPQVRQGARVTGWILLDEVRLGWELWRIFNGFPPSSSPPDPADKNKVGKKMAE